MDALKQYEYYKTENGTLYCGDCLEIMPHLEPVDLVLTDPPYGNIDTHTSHLSKVTLKNGEPAGRVLGFDGLKKRDCLKLSEMFLEKTNGWAVFTCEWHFMESLHEQGNLVRFGIWRKVNGAPQFTGDRPGMGWEAIAICHKRGKKKWNGGGKHAVYNYPKVNSGHPTAKPTALFIELIRDFLCGDTVLDPFMGSGTTAIACERLGRKWIGIEISEKYCEIAAKRIEAEYSQRKLF